MLLFRARGTPTTRRACDQRKRAEEGLGYNAITIFGVKNGSNVWQPVDPHVGTAYKRKIDAYYVEWMANCVPDLAAPSATIPVGKRRQLLTEWTGRAYRELEVARETAKREGRPSLFHAAFLRTGC